MTATPIFLCSLSVWKEKIPQVFGKGADNLHQLLESCLLCTLFFSRNSTSISGTSCMMCARLLA